MIGVPFAHVGGIPIEETLASLGPALLVGFAATWANLRARLRGRAGLKKDSDSPRPTGA
jgi:hypothetical protein